MTILEKLVVIQPVVFWFSITLCIIYSIIVAKILYDVYWGSENMNRIKYETLNNDDYIDWKRIFFYYFLFAFLIFLSW